LNQETLSYPLMRLGIIGGGQLGKMTAQVAKRMGFYVTVLDPWPKCPAEHIADVQIVGDLYDADKLRELAMASDVMTYDVEHIDTQVLKDLQVQGHVIYPSPDLLEVIQDKYKQNQYFEKNSIPTPRFMAVDKLTPDYLAQTRFPIVQKARKGGYDGRGVVILHGMEDIENALKVPSVIEEFVDFTKELAIIIARSPSGETACYPVVEMMFDDRTNICDIVTAPARIDEATAKRAQQIALHAVESFAGVGVFGVEMFLTRAGEILVNEIAPRPHNSGHYTIEACITSQFEQLIRAISGLPLGATNLLKPVAMLNLLGEPEYSGSPRIEGLQKALAIPGVSFHLYGKEVTKPFRKMGHVTVIDDDLEQAIAKVYQVKDILKIKA